MRSAPARPRGFVLPLVLLLIALAFSAWAGLQGTGATSLRQETVRQMREERSAWAGRATAQALRQLREQLMANPAAGPELVWQETVTGAAESRVFDVTALQLLTNRWEVDVTPAAAEE